MDLGLWIVGSLFEMPFRSLSKAVEVAHARLPPISTIIKLNSGVERGLDKNLLIFRTFRGNNGDILYETNLAGFACINTSFIGN